MRRQALKPMKGVLERIMKINALRKLSNCDDEFVSDMLEAAAYTGNEEHFTTLENFLTFLSIDKLIYPDPFGKAPPLNSNSSPGPEIGQAGIFIGNILSRDG